MQFSFNCFNASAWYGIAPDLCGQIDAAASAGYDYVGVDVPSLIKHEEEGVPCAAIADHLREQRMTCFELVPLTLTGDGGRFDANLRRVVDCAECLRPRQVLATLHEPVTSSVGRSLARASRTLAELGVGVSLEFMPTSGLKTLGQAHALRRLAEPEPVGVVIDSWHLLRRPAWRDELRQVHPDEVGFVQLDDAPFGTTDSSRHDSMDRRVLPGQGELPLVEFMAQLMRQGFDGVVSVEVLSAGWRSKPLIEFTTATLEAAREVLRKADGLAVAQAPLGAADHERPAGTGS